MNTLLPILVLLGIVVFLVLRLRSILGTRDGFEPHRGPKPVPTGDVTQPFATVDKGEDRDVTDHVEEGSLAAKALFAMKRVEPSFSVSEFLGGARGAYEMILMAFEKGEIADLQPYLSEEVFETFNEVVESRMEQGLEIDADFVGVREMALADARFDEDTKTAEVTVRFVGELTYQVTNAEGEVLEGGSGSIKRQKDRWTFSRVMGANDPNWQLVATDE